MLWSPLALVAFDSASNKILGVSVLGSAVWVDGSPVIVASYVSIMGLPFFAYLILKNLKLSKKSAVKYLWQEGEKLFVVNGLHVTEVPLLNLSGIEVKVIENEKYFFLTQKVGGDLKIKMRYLDCDENKVNMISSSLGRN